MTKGMFLTFVPLAVMVSLITLIGLFIYVKDPRLDVDMVFLEVLKNYIPSYLFSFGIVLLFA
jgi:hypothetical protein